MKINIRGESVEIEGYVNAIERASRPLSSRIGKFLERICKGAFSRAIQRNENVRILLNHDWNRDLGGTGDGNLELEEDAIGLHARATITDADVVKKARQGDLVGWSFGFSDRDVENSIEDGMPLRRVKDLDLYEVSILDRTKMPAYEGTLVSVRDVDGETQIQFRGEPLLEEPEVREEIAESSATAETKQKEAEIAEEPTEVAEEPVEKPVEKSDEIEKNLDKPMYNEVENIIKDMKGV